MNAYTVRDELSLWWLAEPGSPRRVGTLRFVPRRGSAPAGVSLEYDAAWMACGQALSEDLPLRRGEFLPTEPSSAVGAVDDARPDRWGERVIRMLDRPARLSTLEFLYFAGDDRFGALGVSASLHTYEPRRHGPSASLDDVPTMLELVRQVEAGEPVQERLRRLITPGATLGGARPKALLSMDGADWVLKFAESADVFDSPLIEHATMTLARRAGIQVCETRAIALSRGHAVAVRRFDRADGRRLHALSAHVLLRAAGHCSTWRRSTRASIWSIRARAQASAPAMSTSPAGGSVGVFISRPPVRRAGWPGVPGSRHRPARQARPASPHRACRG